jgi:adenylate cyclase, class 2
MRKEIEVKAKINNIEKIITKLKKLGCKMSKPIIQDDIIFANYSGPFTKHHPGENILRIRKADNKILFTVKQSQKNELDAIEHEIVVDDAKETRAIIEILGYKEEVRVHKIRIKTRYKGWEICVDDVRGLGKFIEVEEITDEKVDGGKVQERLFCFLETLGVMRTDRVANGYDTLMYSKINNIKL